MWRDLGLNAGPLVPQANLCNFYLPSFEFALEPEGKNKSGGDFLVQRNMNVWRTIVTVIPLVLSSLIASSASLSVDKNFNLAFHTH